MNTIFFCDICEGSVTAVELRQGTCRRVEGKLICSSCLREMPRPTGPHQYQQCSGEVREQTVGRSPTDRHGVKGPGMTSSGFSVAAGVALVLLGVLNITWAWVGWPAVRPPVQLVRY